MDLFTCLCYAYRGGGKNNFLNYKEPWTALDAEDSD